MEDNVNRRKLDNALATGLEKYEQRLLEDAASDFSALIKVKQEQSANESGEPVKAVSEASEGDVEGAAESVVNTSEYFSDDDEFLRGDDSILHEELNMSIVQQSEAVVSWTVDNFYNKNGNPRKSTSLRNDPPILTIGDNSGNSASFVLSKEFAGQMESVMGDVYRGYFGVSSKRSKSLNKTDDSFFVKAQSWALENKVKAGLLAAFVVGVLVAAFVL